MGRFQIVAIPAVIAAILWPCFADAAERGTLPMLPLPGEVIPRSVRIGGIDDVPTPRAFGVLILDGRIVVLVDGRTRKVVEILDDASRPPVPSPPG